VLEVIEIRRMKWYKKAFGTPQEGFKAVQRAIMALKYLRPDIDPLTADIGELASALTETGKIPPGVDPLRFAGMVIFYAKNHENVNEIADGM
jgi:hypothetical protein